MMKMVYCILIKVYGFSDSRGWAMRHYMTAVIVALVLGGISAAQAQVTTPTGAPAAPSNGVTTPAPAAGGATAAAAPVDLTEDYHPTQTDYRLSCPYLIATPTVTSCRALLTAPNPGPY